MSDPGQNAAIDHVVRQANRFWFRAGVPRSLRRRKAEELTDHLADAAANGRNVDDVVGSDLAAFAAEWAQADREHPVVDLVLQISAGVIFAIGAFALIGPINPDYDTTGVGPGGLAIIVVVLAFNACIQVVRARRGSLHRTQVLWLGVIGGAAYLVVYLLVVGRALGDDRFWPIPWPIAILLVGIGLAIQAGISWMKRTQRL